MSTNPLALSDTRSSTPVSPPGEKPAPTDQQFTVAINKILEEGIKNSHSQDYVAGEIYKLAQENPELAREHRLTGYEVIKAGVSFAYEQGNFLRGSGNRPLAMSNASIDDFFQMGVLAEAKRRSANTPLTEEEKEVVKRVARDFALMGGAALGVATGVAVAPVVARALYPLLMRAVSAPGRQQVINDTAECLSAMIDESPPPATGKGVACYFADKMYERAKNSETK